MCTVSMVADRWKTSHPSYDYTNWNTLPLGVTKEEFEKLKKEVEELKLLLLAAKRFDKETGQPDCEKEDKIRLITEIAKAVGVDLEEVFGSPLPVMTVTAEPEPATGPFRSTGRVPRL